MNDRLRCTAAFCVNIPASQSRFTAAETVLKAKLRTVEGHKGFVCGFTREVAYQDSGARVCHCGLFLS
jgi:hypothetical protein